MKNNIEKTFLTEELFRAYYDARKNKRNTINQLQFEINLEQNIFSLCDDLLNDDYNISPSIYFINNYPVKREIFAGDFRDRVVHHLIYNYVYDIFDKYFIFDSYSCREGKGTSFGIKRIDKFIRSCSHNYSKDCYILKLDISGYFMNINKDILFEKIEKILLSKKDKLQTDYFFLINLIKKIVYHDNIKNAIFKGKRTDYIGLPKNKSLFFAKPNCGLPIGNLTSQLFSNVYLDSFDKFIKSDLKIKYYGRYVDDFVLISKNKDELKSSISRINNYLLNNLGLEIHPNKIYLQNYKKGVMFLGQMILPYRRYIKKRTLGNFYKKIININYVFKNQSRERKFSFPTTINYKYILSIINSYLGFLKHHDTYKLRKKMLIENITGYFWNYFYIFDDYMIIKKKIIIF